MEALSILENKVKDLLESKQKDAHTIETLSREIEQLKKENADLKENVKYLEEFIKEQEQTSSKLSQEQDDAKACVEKLIQNIDGLIQSEQQ